MKRRAPFVGLAISAALFAGPTAADLPLSRKQADAQVERWLEQLGEIQAQLESGEWARGAKKVDRLLEQMVRRIRTGEGAAELLGTAVAMRAVARAGQGELEEADWDWLTALALRPELAQLDLSRFGEAAKHFTGPVALGRSSEAPVEIDPSLPFTPPRKRTGSAPQDPGGQPAACLEESIDIHFVLDREGRLRSPGWSGGKKQPVLFLAAMEALRDWRFEPAKQGGEPIAILHSLNVTFGLETCRGSGSH